MATRQFSIRTEPHIAQIGDDMELRFVPEVLGDTFLDGYEKLRQAQKRIDSDLADTNPADLREITTSLREFLASLMLPDSAELFAKLALPDRILVELTEWVTELYGGGTTARPTGPSSGSAAVSPSRGTRGSATSPSKASTRTRGR